MIVSTSSCTEAEDGDTAESAVSRLPNDGLRFMLHSALTRIARQ